MNRNLTGLSSGNSAFHSRPHSILADAIVRPGRLLPEGDSHDDPSGSGGDGEGGADKEKDPEGAGSDGGKAGGDDDRDPQRKISALEDEKNRHYNARKTAESRADDLQKQLDEINRKDKSDLENAQTDLKRTLDENNVLKDQLKQARLENAFLSDNTYEWHNPNRALSLADLSSVEIDEDGKVHGLRAALDALAKSDSYLLKPKEGGEGKKDPAEGKTKSGDPANKSTKTKDTTPDREALAAKYPGLRR